jgi:peptidyl-prolyl cis-trans isomerase SurA
MNMGRWSGFVAVAGHCVFIAVIFLAAGLSYGEIMLDKVVAVVNGEVITWSELYQGMEFEASPEVKALGDQERRKLFKESEAAFLENLIDSKIILQAARVAHVGASETEVNNTIKDIKSKHKLSDEAFDKAIAKEGFTLKDYKKKLSEQIIAHKLIDLEVRSKVLVTDKEINDFMLANKEAGDEGYLISLILIKDSGNPGSDEARLKAIYEKLNGGTSFADVAKQYSDDSSARAGGDKGFVRRADLSGEFVNVISKMKKGQVSEPFRTAAGINIVKLVDSRIFAKEGDLKGAIKDRIFNGKFERAFKAWVKGLRQMAYVEIK